METALVGDSRVMLDLRAEIVQAARTDAKVLITGESGSGKEIVARLIHEGSRRSASPCLTVNCAAFTETLLETELFGHVRGSFTGAYRDRSGVFERGHQGTVFLDEVGEMTPHMQRVLLRFLDTGEIQRVGSDGPQTRADVRIISATNRVLIDSVAERTFREDLYYRLNVIQLAVPPLRNRAEDVPALLDHFLRVYAREHGGRQPVISAEALDALTAYSWPGNVRELRNLAERLLVQYAGREVGIDHLGLPSLTDGPNEVSPPPTTSTVVDAMWQDLTKHGLSFWSVAHGPFMSRDLTRADLRALVTRGLKQTKGDYKRLVQLFNMEPDDDKRFLTFLRKYHCHVPFQQFRFVSMSDADKRLPGRAPIAKGA